MKRFDRAGRKVQILAPGALYFGVAPALLYTLLGSCVAITLWHPLTGHGGMCHYLLAHRNRFQSGSSQPHGYFASDAIEFFQRKIAVAGLRPKDCVVRLFGGGNMLGEINPASRLPNVAQANIDTGRELLAQEGFQPQLSDVGGKRYRKLYFDLSSGDIWVQYGRNRRSPHSPGEPLQSRSRR